jgi:hypothetical protein
MVGSSDRVFQLVAVTVFRRNRTFLSIYPCMHQICYLLMITSIFVILLYSSTDPGDMIDV